MRKITIVIPAGATLKLAGSLLAFVVLAVAAFMLGRPAEPSKASASVRSNATGPLSIALASPGRIEGESDSIAVGAAMDGVIRSIRVVEGQHVVRNQILAQMDCRELESAQQVAQAEAESLRQGRLRLLRGSRSEEREAAAQKTTAAKAVFVQASGLLERNRRLVASDSISRTAYEESMRNAKVAEAEYEQAKHLEQLVNVNAMPEEIARADADVRAAEQRIEMVQEKAAKCVVRAPINGTILRVIRREGESFSTASGTPIITLANLSGRRVRAEVDERDVGRVRIGQKVLVSSESYAGRRFQGTVSTLAAAMGKKSVITGDPADKADRDILEVTAKLDGANTLPVGLRVTVEFIQ